MSTAAEGSRSNDAALVRTTPEAANRRLDQWLWFARLAKSRSRAASLCAAGAVAVNGRTVKPRHTIRIGDAVSVPQRARCRLVKVRGLGVRRGPAGEARSLYEEMAAPEPIAARTADWLPLLADDLPGEVDDGRSQ